MSTDSLIGIYVGSRISTYSLMGKYPGFGILRTSSIYLRFTMYVFFRFDLHIPFEEERPHYFVRHKSPQP